MHIVRCGWLLKKKSFATEPELKIKNKSSQQKPTLKFLSMNIGMAFLLHLMHIGMEYYKNQYFLKHQKNKPTSSSFRKPMYSKKNYTYNKNS